MHKISTNLNKIYDAIRDGKAVHITKHGELSEAGFFARFATIFSSGEHACVKLALDFSLLLDFLEETPIVFSSLGKQAVDYAGYLRCAELIVEKLNVFSTALAETVAGELKRRIAALKYRLEGIYGGADPESCILPELENKLLQFVEEWKLNDPMQEDKSLSEKDRQRIHEACAYPLFLAVIFAHKKIREAFIQWSFRDGNAVRPFVEFPAFVTKIVESQLNGRIARSGGEDLRIEKVPIAADTYRKILTLPMEGRRENILDLNRQVAFRGGYVLSIKQILKVFKDKTYRVGNLEYLQDGIVNWNVHHLGWWNADLNRYEQIDLAKKNWWEQLPFLEILSLDQMKALYGSYVDGIMWVAAARASRGTPTLDFDQTHAFLEVAIPMQGGKYALYEFGKFAYIFPSSFFENLTFFCRNVHATVAFPDENIFYTHRQQTRYAFSLTASEGIHLMDAIKADMLKARQKNFVFQIESENCAKWTYEKLESALGKGTLPNLFRMHLLDTEPVGFVAVVFSLLKKLPYFIGVPILTALHLPFGASQRTWIMENGELVCKSLTSHHFWQTAEVYLPAYLHKQVKEGFSSQRSAMPFNDKVPLYPLNGSPKRQLAPEMLETFFIG